MAVLSSFYVDQSTLPLSTTHQKMSWGFSSSLLILVNDETSGSKKVYFSYNDPRLDGSLTPQDKFTLSDSSLASIWLWCDGAGAPNYRLFVEADT